MMQNMDNARSQFERFKRLHQAEVDLWIDRDPECLERRRWYPMFKSFDLFVEAFPSDQAREEMIEETLRSKALTTRGLDEGEAMVEEFFGRSIDSYTEGNPDQPATSGWEDWFYD